MPVICPETNEACRHRCAGPACIERTEAAMSPELKAAIIRAARQAHPALDRELARQDRATRVAGLLGTVVMAADAAIEGLAAGEDFDGALDPVMDAIGNLRGALDDAGEP